MTTPARSLTLAIRGSELKAISAFLHCLPSSPLLPLVALDLAAWLPAIIKIGSYY